ncbi:MAG: hypothetical protein ABI231_00895, partial [Candidatus Tumulicola sp.]
MKLHLNDRACRYVLGAAIAALVMSGCSSHGWVPSAGAGANLSNQTRQPLPASSQIRSSLGASSTGAASGAIELVGGDTCNVFPLLCVKQGHSASMGIKITCTKGSKKVSCGSVTWSTKTGNSGLKWSFTPNPGNPTTETIKAVRTLKIGTY